MPQAHPQISPAPAGRHDRLAFVAAVLLVLGTLAVGVGWATTAASGPDAHGYVSQADGWLAGRPTVDQSWAADAPWPMARWTLAPLGYHPSQAAGDEWRLVPAYSPGLPMLLAAAKATGGQELMFWVVPLSGAVLVLATFAIARRLISPAAGVIAAWLTATSPTVLFMLVLPMSDLPAAAAWAVAVWCLLDPRTGRAALAGVAAGVATVIRPNLAPCAVALALWPFVSAMRQEPGAFRRAIARAGAFAPGVVAGALVVAVVNASLNGSPFTSGYGSLSGAFSLQGLLPNLTRYITWLAETQTPLAVAGAVALFVPARRLWPAAGATTSVPVLAALTAVVWLSYGLYRTFDAWWFLRFMLPSWPFLMTGSAALLHLLLRPGRRRLHAIAVAVTLFVGAFQVSVAIDRGVFRLWQEDRRAVTVARHVRDLTPSDSVVFSRQHSGSVRYYAGRLTARFEEFEPGDLDTAVAWFASRGVSSYLLVDEVELPMARRALAGQETSVALDGRPLLHYSGSMQVYMFALNGSPDRTVPTRSVRETWADTRSVSPVPFVLPAGLSAARPQ